jgi:hypothetical protein
VDTVTYEKEHVLDDRPLTKEKIAELKADAVNLLRELEHEESQANHQNPPHDTEKRHAG